MVLLPDAVVDHEIELLPGSLELALGHSVAHRLPSAVLDVVGFIQNDYLAFELNVHLKKKAIV